MDSENGIIRNKNKLQDLETLYHLVFKRMCGKTLQERLNSFYRGQESHYDSFRERLLSGRADLFNLVSLKPGSIWVDMGGGTGASFEALGPNMATLKKAYVVDLCEPLLEIAQQRKKRNGWDNMEIVHADALSFTLPGDERADVVSFTYSLTMIPEWYAAIDRAAAMLKPGGCCAACDFFVGNPFRITEKQKSHNWATRLFWRVWFETDGVFPSTDHVPYLTRRFALQYYHQNRAKLPYLPLVSAPYYLFVGMKPE